jgi:hypothetical protein
MPQQNMSDDILEVKPGIGPFKLNLRAAFRWFRRLSSKSKPDPVIVVAQRFIQLFEEHGVPDQQIPRLIPSLSLNKLRNVDTLLPFLTNKLLEETARLFHVRRDWFDGLCNVIYDTAYCYKQPERFFQEFAAMQTGDTYHPIIVICCMARLDRHDEREQPVGILLRSKLCEIDEKEIYRYRIFGDGWRWTYWKSRIQLKAMIRVFDKFQSATIPIYRLEEKALQSIISGCRVPHRFLQGRPVDEMCLEDFALFESESAQAKEAEELPEVLEYINHHDLENVARSILHQEEK